MLERHAFSNLLDWKKQEKRKPLLILGARQVGKTFLLEKFAQKNFNSYHLFDFVENEDLIPIFEGSLEPKSLLTRLSTYTGIDIDLQNDLIIFDEIQQCPKALTALKYFEKHTPEAYICGSGSLLGVSFSESPFPVGKIERLDLGPLSFLEFLQAMQEDKLAQEIKNLNLTLFENPTIHKKTWELLLYYFITGGLPEIINIFINNYEQINKTLELVRAAQKRIIKDYEADFIKYANRENALHLRAVFREVPAQLAQQKTNSGRFIFKGTISENSTYRELEGPIEWLEAAKLIFKLPITEHSATPIAAYASNRKFKLYLFDIGLLGCMVGLSYKNILSYDYGGYKGYFAENFVLQELFANHNSTGRQRTIVSWSRNNSAEIEFLIEESGEITPLEVKAGINTKAKSMTTYSKLYQPSKSLLLTGNPVISASGDLQYLPLYFAGVI